MLSILNTMVEVPVWFPVAAVLAGGLVGVLSLCVSLLVLNRGSASRKSVPDRSKVAVTPKPVPTKARAKRVSVALSHRTKSEVSVARANVTQTSEPAPEPAPVVRKKGSIKVGSVVVSKTLNAPPAPAAVSAEPVLAPPPASANTSPAVRETLSIGEAAKKAEIARTSIYRWIQNGKIQATRVDDEWRIDAESLNAVLGKE